MLDLKLIVVCIFVIGAVVWLLTRKSSRNTDQIAIQTDAKRFARLLVAEIKLCNESTVEKGKRVNDVYSLLEAEINHARRRYRERINVRLTEKDYFDEQVIELLADGDATKMGARYAESKKT